MFSVLGPLSDWLVTIVGLVVVGRVIVDGLVHRSVLALTRSLVDLLGLRLPVLAQDNILEWADMLGGEHPGDLALAHLLGLLGGEVRVVRLVSLRLFLRLLEHEADNMIARIDAKAGALDIDNFEFIVRGVEVPKNGIGLAWISKSLLSGIYSLILPIIWTSV